MLSSTLIFDHPTARQVALPLQGSSATVAAVLADDGARSVSSGALDMDALRQMSDCGRDLMCEVPLSRWDVQQAGT